MYPKFLLISLSFISAATFADAPSASFSKSQTMTLVGSDYQNLQQVSQETGLWISNNNRYQAFTASRSPLSSGCQNINVSWQAVNHRQPFFCRQDTALLQTLALNQQVSFSNYGASQTESFANRAWLTSSANQNSQNSYIALDTASSQRSALKGQYAGDSWSITAGIVNDAGYKHRSDQTGEQLQFNAQQQFENLQLQHHVQLQHHKQDIAGMVSETFARNNKKAYEVDDNRRFNPNDNSQQQGHSLLASTAIIFDAGNNKTLHLQPYLTFENFEQQDQQHFAGIDWQQKKQSLGLLGSFTRPALNNSLLITGFNMDYSQGNLEQQSLNTPALKQLDYRLSSMQIASFLQLQSNLSSTVTSDIGLRLENSRYRYHNKLDNGAICDDQGVCPFSRLDDDKQSFFHIAPMAEISWHYLPEHQSYWRFDKKVRAPSNQQLYQSQADINPSSLREIASYTIEWGFQGNMNSFSYLLASYAQRNHGLIVETANSQQFQNQKSLRLGAQIKLDWQPHQDWRLSLHSDIANERYDSSSQALTIEDKRVAFAPTQTHQVQLQWQASTSSQVQLNWRFIDKYYLDAEHSASYDGHQLLDASFTQKLARAWQWSIGLENITNEYYANFAELSDQAIGGEYLPQYDVGLGRVVHISLSYQFK